MSPSMAAMVTRQYPPHWALLVTLNQTKHRNGITGTAIADAISAEFLHPMPRYNIQASIGTLIPAATTNSDAAGWRCVASSHVIPTTLKKMAALTIIPTTMTASI